MVKNYSILKKSLIILGSRDVTLVRDGVSVYVDEVFSNKEFNRYKVYSLVLGTKNQIRKRNNLNEIVINIKSFDPLAKLEYCKKVLPEIKKIKNKDIIILNGLSVVWILPILKYRYPKSKIIIIHHSAEFVNKSLSFSKRLIANLALKISLISPHHISVSSFLRKLIPISITIRNGAKKMTKYDYNLNCKCELLYLGRLVKEKGIIDLAYKLKKLDSGIVLTCISPVKSPVIENKLISIYKNIQFLSGLSRKNVLGYVNGSKLVIIPSFNEGFSLVSQEALNLGKIPFQRDLKVLREFNCPEYAYFDDNNFDEKFNFAIKNIDLFIANKSYQRTLENVVEEWINYLKKIF